MAGRDTTSRLRAARRAANLRQVELAEKAQVAQSVVSDLERLGASPRPPWSPGVRRVAAALDTTPEALFGPDPWTRAQAIRATEAREPQEATA
jgi:transcriptional regulator with XRE-family HTH domain